MSLVVGSLTISGVACAHGTEKHGKMIATDARMKKLHAMMPAFSLACAEMETALERGDAAIVAAEAEKITTAIPDLKKSKPHKNLKQKEKFMEHVANLEKTVRTTVNLAKKGDLAEAKVSFQQVHETCAACHAKFRD
ncbi:MAG: cytochrome c [Pelobacteraceae bacterium]